MDRQIQTLDLKRNSRNIYYKFLVILNSANVFAKKIDYF
jgi:hypothetical protein